LKMGIRVHMSTLQTRTATRMTSVNTTHAHTGGVIACCGGRACGRWRRCCCRRIAGSRSGGNGSRRKARANGRLRLLSRRFVRRGVREKDEFAIQGTYVRARESEPGLTRVREGHE